MNFSENQQACNILEKLWSQRESGRFCDIVLHVQGKKFQAHRNVLAACSPYFDSVLKTHKIIKEQLTITCQNLDAFQLLLHYMYTGAVALDKNNVAELLRLANHFLVLKLKNHCAEYLDRYIDTSNCLAIKDMADKYSLPVLQKNVSAFIHSHIVEIFEQKEILELSLCKLEVFLKENQCLVPPHLLLIFICNWVEHDVTNRENDFRNLLTFINWVTIELKFLEEHLKACNLLLNYPKCMYLILACLEENKIDVPEHTVMYSSLKSQYGPGGTNVDSDCFMNIAISAAIHGLQKFQLGSIEENTPITVVPLEKDQLKDKSVSETHEPSKGSIYNDNDTSNSSFDDGGVDYPDNEDDSQSSNEPSINSGTGEKDFLQKKTEKESGSPNKISSFKTSVKSPNKRMKQKSLSKMSKQKRSKVEDENTAPNKNVDYKKQNASETDTEDDEDEDNAERSSSATDSSVDESFNDHYTKSKWKDGVKCPNCPYIAHSSIRLEQHVYRIHAREVIYKCKVCEFTCKGNQEYYKHMKTHYSGPPYCCEFCTYNCDKIQFLLAHRMRHTDERPFKCEECDHRCRTKADLDSHMRCHTGEKPYHCEHCDGRFADKVTLDQHLASHRDDRPFLCDTCGFSTKYQSHLFSHQRIHTGDVFHCHFPNCKYSTPKKSQLGSHHRTHTAVRSHVCSVCGRAFIEKSHLVRHERIHLNEKPFKCEHCDYCSSRRDKLKEHFRKHHGENATAKGPYRPRKQRRQGYEMGAYSNKNPAEKEKHPSQSMELSTSVRGSKAPLVYGYDSPHQDSIHSHAAVALQQLGAAAHNYPVPFMDRRPHVGSNHPSFSALVSDQNRLNTSGGSSHDANVRSASEFGSYMSYM